MPDKFKQENLPLKRKLFFIGSVLILLVAFIDFSGGCKSNPVTQSAMLDQLKVTDTVWQLVYPTEYAVKQTLKVSDSGDIAGFSGVNNYQGKLQSDFHNGRFQFDGAVAVTMKMGENMAQESAFLQLLNQAEKWRWISSPPEVRLELLDKNGKVIAAFRPAAEK